MFSSSSESRLFAFEAVKLEPIRQRYHTQAALDAGILNPKTRNPKLYARTLNHKPQLNARCAHSRDVTCASNSGEHSDTVTGAEKPGKLSYLQPYLWPQNLPL